jgi:hypothetical protein
VRYAGAKEFPMDVTLEGIAPFVPLDENASGIPAAFLRITIENTGTAELKGDLFGWLENGAAAHSGYEGEGFRTASLRQLPGALAIEFAAQASEGTTSKEPRPPILLADFETTDYMGWKATGEAFGTRPTLHNEFAKAQASEPLQNTSGSACAASATGGATAFGVLQSPEFPINRDMLRFNTAWGRDEKKLRVELQVDGKAVRTATGPGGPRLRPDPVGCSRVCRKNRTVGGDRRKREGRHSWINSNSPTPISARWKNARTLAEWAFSSLIPPLMQRQILQ